MDHPSRKFLNSYFRRSLLRERILLYISIDKFRLKICIISFYIFIQENNLRTMAPVFQSGRDLKFRNSIFLGPLRTKKESDFFAKNIILFLYAVSRHRFLRVNAINPLTPHCSSTSWQETDVFSLIRVGRI